MIIIDMSSCMYVSKIKKMVDYYILINSHKSLRRIRLKVTRFYY